MKIEGIIDVKRDAEFDDEKKYRNGGIRLIYPGMFSPLEGIEEGVLLEAGFDNVAPNDACNISSWAYEYAASIGVDEERFRTGDNTKISENEAFRLSDPQTYKLYEDAYSNSTGLYYQTQPTFEEIISNIKVHIDSL